MNIAISPEIQYLLSENSPVAIGVSGGKDSGAAAWATVQFLDSVGHRGPRILIHADLGRTEWADSLPTCQRLSERLGVELVVVRRKAGDMLTRWQGRWENNVRRYVNLECVKLILPWSTPKMRFCTSELKSAIIAAELVKRWPGQKIISVTGIRNQESKERAKKLISAPNNRLTNKTRRTVGFDWNPIIRASLDEVWHCHRENNLPVHEAYTRYGMSRVSCAFCIMSSAPDLFSAAGCADNQPLYRQMVDLEIASTFAFQGSKWLGDVAPHLLTSPQRVALNLAKQAAQFREGLESKIPAHLLYTKGWPTCMPTQDEAVLLGDIRRAVARVMGLEIKYRNPDEIMARYAELMDLKKKKTA